MALKLKDEVNAKKKKKKTDQAPQKKSSSEIGGRTNVMIDTSKGNNGKASYGSRAKDTNDKVEGRTRLYTWQDAENERKQYQSYSGNQSMEPESELEKFRRDTERLRVQNAYNSAVSDAKIKANDRQAQYRASHWMRHPEQEAVQNYTDAATWRSIASYAAQVGDKETYDDAMKRVEASEQTGDKYAGRYKSVQQQRAYTAERDYGRQMERLAEEDPGYYKYLTSTSEQARQAQADARAQTEAAYKRRSDASGALNRYSPGEETDGGVFGKIKAGAEYDAAKRDYEAAWEREKAWDTAAQYHEQNEREELNRRVLSQSDFDAKTARDFFTQARDRDLARASEGRSWWTDSVTAPSPYTLLDQMSEDEQAVYGYLLSKGLTQDAYDYFALARDELQYRHDSSLAKERYVVDRPQNIDDTAMKLLRYTFDSAATGLERAGYGIGNVFERNGKEFDTEGSRLLSNATQQMEENGSEAGSFLYRNWGSAMQSLGQMAPAMLAGWAGGAIAGAMGTGVAGTGALSATNIAATQATVGQLAQNSVFFLSCKGNAYADAKSQRGMSDAQAEAYSTLSALTEVYLQDTFGSVLEYGGIGNSQMAERINMLDNALARSAGKVGLAYAGEIFLDEVPQDFLDPFYETILTGRDYEAPTAAELLDTIASTAMMVSASNIGDTVSAVQQSQIKSNLRKVEDLARKLGQTDSRYQQLADHIGAYILEVDSHPETMAYTPADVQAVLYWRNGIERETANIGESVSQSQESVDAMRKYAEDNGMTFEYDTQAKTVQDAAARAEERAAARKAEAEAQNEAEAQETEQEAPVEQTRSEKRAAKKAEREQTRQAVREAVEVGEAIQSVGQGSAQIVDSISKRLEGKTLAEIGSVKQALTEQYGAGIETAVDAAVERTVRQRYAAAETMDALQQAHRDFVANVSDPALRQIDERAYNAQTLRLQENAAEGRQARTSGRSMYAKEELDLRAEYEDAAGAQRSTVARFADDGKRVVLENGKTVAISQLAMDADAKDVLTRISQLGLSGNAASELLYNVKAYGQRNGTMGWYEYLTGFYTAYEQGRSGIIKADEAVRRSPIDEDAARYAYELGRRQVQESSEEAQAEIKEKREEAKKKGVTGRKGTVDKSAVDESKISKSARRSLDLWEAASAEAGIDTVLFASEQDKSGRFKGMNGKYQDGKLWIDVNAGYSSVRDLRTVRSGILRTVAHELTHFGQDFSPALYQQLKDFAFAVLGEELGVEGFEDLIDAKLARDSTGKLTRAGAEDEIIADACEMMLKNSPLVQKALEQNPGLVEKLLGKAMEIIDALREIFGSARHEEARVFERLDEQLAELQKLWNAMIEDAVQAHKEIGDITTKDAGQFSDRDSEALEQAVRPEFRRSDLKQMLKDYEGGHQSFPVAQGIVDEFVAQYKQSGRQAQMSEREDLAGYSNGVRGNGYDGYSMSNNARDAYDRGERPMSKWTKTEILDRVAQIDPDKAELLRGVDAETLRKHLLEQTGWHHTSSMYNRTNFYGIDEDAVEGLTKATVDSWGKASKQATIKDAYRGDFHYTEWSGTRNHPKATNRTLTDVNIQEKGNFYIVTDDDGNVLVRKKIGSNGTRAESYAERNRWAEARRAREETRINNSTEAANELYAAMKKRGMEYSTSGNIYENGRKPSRYDYNLGIEKFFKNGEQRLAPNESGGYSVETWRDGKWVGEESQAQMSERDVSDVSDEELLMQADEAVAENDEQRALLREYQKKAHEVEDLHAKIEEQQQALAEVRKERAALKGKVDRRDAALKRERQKASEQASQSRETIKEQNADIRKKDRSLKAKEATIQNAIQVLQKQVERGEQIMDGKLGTKQMQALLKNVRETAANAVKEQKDAQIRKIREGRKVRELKGRIGNLVDTMRKQLLKPSEKKYIPQQFIGNVLDMLDLIDTGTNYSAKLAALDEKIAKAKTDEQRQKLEDQKTRLLDRQSRAQDRINALAVEYEAIRKDENMAVMYDETVSELLRELSATVGDRTLGELSVDELSDVYTAVKAIYTTVRNAIKADEIERGRTTYEIGDGMIEELRSGKGRMALPFEKYVSWHLDARRMFNRFGGRRTNSYWNKVYNMLNDAQHDTQYIEMMLTKELGGLLGTKRGRKMLEQYADTSDRKMVDVGLKDANGNTVKITRGMMMSLYMHLLNEDNVRHLMYGGLTLPNIKRYYKGSEEAWGRDEIRIPALGANVFELSAQLSDMDATTDAYSQKRRELDQATKDAGNSMKSLQGQIESQMTEFDREFVKAAQSFFDLSAKILNNTTRKMYGFSKANVKNYFPIHTDSDFLTASFENITKDLSLENMGFMKERVKSGKPILLEDATRVINQQIGNVAKYAGMTPAIKTFNGVYSVQGKRYADSVQKSLKAFGANGQKYVDNLMSDLVGSRSQPGTIFDRLKGYYARGVLAGNISVTMKQAASYPTAAAVVGWGPLLHALARGGKNNWALSRADRALIDTYTPLLWQRAKGAIDTEFGDIARGRDWTQKAGWLMNWIQKTDVATVGRLWSAAEYYVKKNNKGLEVGTKEQIESGESAYYKEVARVFNRIVEETQPNYSVLQRPDILRNPNAMIRACTMFMTQRVQNVQILYDAVGELHAKRQFYRQNKNSETKAELATARKNFNNAVSSQIVSTMVLNAMTLIAAALLHRMNPYRDDDEELTLESILKAYGAGMLESVSGSILGGSEIYDFLSSKLTGDKYYEPDIGGWSTVTDFASNASKFYDGVKKWIENDEYKAADFLSDYYKRFIQTATKLTGIPAENLYKIGEGIYRNIEDAMNGELGTFESGLDRAVKSEVNRYFKALDAGDDAKMNAVRDELVQHYLDLGKSAEDAAKEADEQLVGGIHDRFKDGTYDEETARELLVGFGKDEDDAYWKVKEWEFKADADDGESWSVYNRLREAVESGKGIEESITELTEHGKKQKDVETEIGKTVKQLYNDGSIGEDDARRLLEKYKGLDADEAYWAVEKWDAQAEDGDDFRDTNYRNLYDAIDANQSLDSAIKELKDHGYKDSQITQQVKDYISTQFREGNYTEEKYKNYLARYCGITKTDEVNKLVNEGRCYRDTGISYNNIDTAYKDGDITAAQAQSYLRKYGGVSDEDAKNKTRAWDFQTEHKDLDWDTDTITAYYDTVPKTVISKSAYEANIPVTVYDEFLTKKKDVKGVDADGDGNTDSGSVKQAYINMIAELNLTPEQKELLLRLKYDKPKKKNEDREYNIPWH